MHAINSGNITSPSEEDIEDFNRQMKVQAAAKGLGTHVLFTHNTTELLKRVDTAVHANARWRNYFRGLVDYFDPSTFEGKLTSRASPKPTPIHTNGSTASSFATPGVDRSR